MEKFVLVPHDKYQRLLQKKEEKTPLEQSKKEETVPSNQPKEKETEQSKEHISTRRPPPGKREVVTPKKKSTKERNVAVGWIAL